MFGSAVIALGWVILLLPLVPFVILGGYVYLTNPADQSGWGAIIGGLMILNMASVPAGLVLLLIGFVFKAAARNDINAA